jgi:hypothetical protein
MIGNVFRGIGGCGSERMVLAQPSDFPLSHGDDANPDNTSSSTTVRCMSSADLQPADPHPPSSSATRRTLTADGHTWTVSESRTDGGDRARSLIFDAEVIVRRVRSYPADWHELPDTALAALARRI